MSDIIYTNNSDDASLREAYNELGSEILWRMPDGEYKRVVDMPLQSIVRCLDSLDKENPNSLWRDIFKIELLNRFPII